MKFVIASIAASLIATSASAQPQQPTPSEQVLGGKLMQEIQGGLNCGINLIAVQAELDKAKARIKEMESKASEPAK